MTDLFEAFCDDAAVFPPGNLPLATAVPAHRRHTVSAYAGVVGSFVLAARQLPALAELVADAPAGSLGLALTMPIPDAADTLAAVATIPAVRLRAAEVALPDGFEAARVVPSLAAVGFPAEVDVYVELPRDARRDAVLAALSGTRYLAKLRTGGVRRDLYPEDGELAETVRNVVRAGVSFKATAGLHHALRNTEPGTGFEQHGFLNLLLAADAAAEGADVATLTELLAQRDAATVAASVRTLSPDVRKVFRSFGTCSISEPVDELVDLGLLPDSFRTRNACPS